MAKKEVTISYGISEQVQTLVEDRLLLLQTLEAIRDHIPEKLHGVVDRTLESVKRHNQ